MNKTLRSLVIVPLMASFMTLTSPVFAEEKKQETTIEKILKFERNLRNNRKLRLIGEAFKKNGDKYLVFRNEGNIKDDAELTVTYRAYNINGKEGIGLEPDMIFYNVGKKSVWDTNTGDIAIKKGKNGIYREHISIAGSKFT